MPWAIQGAPSGQFPFAWPPREPPAAPPLQLPPSSSNPRVSPSVLLQVAANCRTGCWIWTSRTVSSLLGSLLLLGSAPLRAAATLGSIAASSTALSGAPGSTLTLVLPANGSDWVVRQESPVTISPSSQLTSPAPESSGVDCQCRHPWCCPCWPSRSLKPWPVPDTSLPQPGHCWPASLLPPVSGLQGHEFPAVRPPGSWWWLGVVFIPSGGRAGSPSIWTTASTIGMGHCAMLLAAGQFPNCEFSPTVRLW